MTDSANLAELVDSVEFAVYRLGCAVFLGSLRVDDMPRWASYGYVANQRDEHGCYVVWKNPKCEIKVRLSGRGSAISYRGHLSVEIYEEFLRRALGRGFEFAHGERKPPEDFFVMDTVASENGLIGVMGMSRTLVEQPTMFSISIFPGHETRH